MFKIEFKNGNTYLYDLDCFCLAITLDCGQAFRWRKISETAWEGIAKGKHLKIEQNENIVILYNTTQKDYYELWEDYFDFKRDYGKIISLIKNPKLKNAANLSRGIRILRQDPWEALCSFIISQNNNIPRIKGIIERLCENFGEKIIGGYSFPSAQRLAELSEQDLAVLRCGFRTKYILDAAKKVADGTVDLEKTSKLSTDAAREELIKIYGVGNKVADCTLLFGFGHLNAFPKDVWIKRALEKMFGGKLLETESEFAGVYQQYIFYYAREEKI